MGGGYRVDSLGDVDFSDIKLPLKAAVEGREAVTMNVGVFLNNVITCRRPRCFHVGEEVALAEQDRFGVNHICPTTHVSAEA